MSGMNKPLLGFDIYALVEPKTPADVVACCNEALAELAVINGHLDEILKGSPQKPFKAS